MEAKEQMSSGESAKKTWSGRIAWWTAATLVVSGVTPALGLVALFLFPFLPLIGLLLVIQLSSRVSAPATAAETEAPRSRDLSGSRFTPQRSRAQLT